MTVDLDNMDIEALEQLIAMAKAKITEKKKEATKDAQNAKLMDLNGVPAGSIIRFMFKGNETLAPLVKVNTSTFTVNLEGKNRAIQGQMLISVETVAEAKTKAA